MIALKTSRITNENKVQQLVPYNFHSGLNWPNFSHHLMENFPNLFIVNHLLYSIIWPKHNLISWMRSTKISSSILSWILYEWIHSQLTIYPTCSDVWACHKIKHYRILISGPMLYPIIGYHLTDYIGLLTQNKKLIWSIIRHSSDDQSSIIIRNRRVY